LELSSLTGEDNCEAGIVALKDKVPTLVVTRGENGAVCATGGALHKVAAEPVEKVIDTTGAGDLFAAGFLFGHVRGEEPARCLRRGAIAAAEIISHYGARPESDLAELMKKKLS
ncbi:MAG: PfkB family carbohydrate kinase, partial [Alteraurantiacibacter sp.]